MHQHRKESPFSGPSDCGFKSSLLPEPCGTGTGVSGRGRCASTRFFPPPPPSRIAQGPRCSLLHVLPVDGIQYPPPPISPGGGGLSGLGGGERGNDTSKSTGRSGRQNAATRRNMRREERATVQGPVKEQQPDGMSHGGGGGRKRHTMPHSAQPQHTNHWAPRTRKRHQQEHRPQRPTERSDPTQHAKGRTGDCPGPRKGATTRRNVTQGGGVKSISERGSCRVGTPFGLGMGGWFAAPGQSRGDAFPASRSCLLLHRARTSWSSPSPSRWRPACATRWRSSSARP